VEPKYGKKIETLEELLISEFLLGYNQDFLQTTDTVAYPEIVKFFVQRTQKEEYTGNYSCVVRTITKRAVATISSPLYAGYRARELGILDVGKIICPLMKI